MLLALILLEAPPANMNTAGVLTLVLPLACLALVLLYWRLAIWRRGGRF
jgi:hypothetical protein